MRTQKKLFMQLAESNKYHYYIQLYNMHSPTLETVLMVEKAAKKHSQEYGKYQLWKKLPRKMMYQTFLTVLHYLEESGKLFVSKDGKVVWTYDPKQLQKLRAEGLTFR